jgi:hypothetical protein
LPTGGAATDWRRSTNEPPGTGSGAAHNSVHGPVPDKNQARDRPPFDARRPSLYLNVALYCQPQTQLLDTKKVELVRLVFSIGVTVFVSVGTFLAIRYLIGSSG